MARPSLAGLVGARAARLLQRALWKPAPETRRFGMSDLLGFSAFRGIADSANSIVVLGIAALAIFLLMRGALAVGAWVIVLGGWSLIGMVLYRNRDRIKWGRLRLLLKPVKPSQPD